VQVGQNYFGYLFKKTDYEFVVAFANALTGLLSFKDLEAHSLSPESFELGETVKVYAVSCSMQNRRLVLSLSQQGLQSSQQL